MERNTQMDRKNSKKILLFGILFLVFMLGLTVVLFPYFQRLAEPAFQEQIQRKIDEIGMVGVFAILGAQILQIVIAFIPGEPVEILAGVLYGPIGGAAICLIGCVLASSFVFGLSKKYGKKLLCILFRAETVQQWRWLKDSKKMEAVTFLLFLIPGTPKDMLTYVAGTTELRLGKFLCLTLLARIPSILSSTVIGSTAGRGQWAVSLIVFLLTGAIGLLGLFWNDKAIDACRKTAIDAAPFTNAEPLDFVEEAHANKVFPLMYCHLRTTGGLDIERLKKAVSRSAQYVPEILYAYDKVQRRFVSHGFDAERVFVPNPTNFENCPRWDLHSDVQLKISIQNVNDESNIVIAMSHLLSDGEGFKQYLYLLAALYNEEHIGELKNEREVSALLKTIHIQRPTQQTRSASVVCSAPLLPRSKGGNYTCLNCCLAPNELTLLREKAKKRGVSLNDIFMAAYARVIARSLDENQVVIPCPADLRQFILPAENKLTVANMTGIYRTLVTDVEREHNFGSTLEQVHIEMNIQKSRYRCFVGIRPLAKLYCKLPVLLLKKVIQATYRLSPVSYTNLGVIDSSRLAFRGCDVARCYLTGSYRAAPDFQLSISTFDDVCNLNCMLIGGQANQKAGQRILEQVKNELLEWTIE